MARIKQIGIVAVALLLLLNGWVPPAAWAQSAQPSIDEPSTGQKVAAVFSNIFRVPLKGLVLCPISGGLWVVNMVVTGGGQYNEAANVVKIGCGGKWIVEPEDIRFSQ